MSRYLVTDLDLEPFHRLITHADGLSANSLPQSDYDTLIEQCRSTLATLAPLGTATAALISSRLADTQRHARAIRDGRLAAGLSQAHLGNLVGMNQGAISRIEAGTLAVSPARLDMIMAALAPTARMP